MINRRESLRRFNAIAQILIIPNIYSVLFFLFAFCSLNYGLRNRCIISLTFLFCGCRCLCSSSCCRRAQCQRNFRLAARKKYSTELCALMNVPANACAGLYFRDVWGNWHWSTQTMNASRLQYALGDLENLNFILDEIRYWTAKRIQYCCFFIIFFLSLSPSKFV